MPLLLLSTFLLELAAHTGRRVCLVGSLWLGHFLTINGLVIQNAYIDCFSSPRFDVHRLLYHTSHDIVWYHLTTHFFLADLLFLAQEHLNERFCVHAVKLS